MMLHKITQAFPRILTFMLLFAALPSTAFADDVFPNEWNPESRTNLSETQTQVHLNMAAHQFVTSSVYVDAYVRGGESSALTVGLGSNLPGSSFYYPVAYGQVGKVRRQIELDPYDDFYNKGLKFTVNTNGSQNFITLPLYVDKSHRLQMKYATPGRALDYDGKRVLYAANRSLYIHDTVTGVKTTVFAQNKIVSSGQLTSEGCLFQDEQGNLYEWYNQQVEPLNVQAQALKISGHYATYTASDGILYLRNLLTHTSAPLTLSGEVLELGDNGVIIYRVNNTFYKYKNGVSNLWFEESPTERLYAFHTDGQAALYVLGDDTMARQVKFHGATGEVSTLAAFTDPIATNWVTTGFGYNKGWVIYSRQAPGTITQQLFMINPAGQQKQIIGPNNNSSYGVSALNDDGKAILTFGGYLCTVEFNDPRPVPFSGTLGRVKYVNGEPFRLIGNALLAVTPSSESIFSGTNPGMGNTINPNHIFSAAYTGHITAGPGLHGIEIRSEYMDEKVTFTTEIAGNQLFIKPSAPLKGSSHYTLYLPYNAVTDLKGVPTDAYDHIIRTRTYGAWPQRTEFSLNVWDRGGIDHARISVTRLDEDGNETPVNQAFTDLSGYYKTKILQKGKYRFTVSADGYVPQSMIINIQNSRESASFWLKPIATAADSQ
ncbi:hypothetical protein SY83_04255 [Paenibacillus swuensis]|uniref:Uncharacterized protein n=1 Tax=Paenibacillus swuensis TaxID=1178515 RepID=A0A172TFA7_9BACL|nr:carboxypeptidase-like regulatory domain-containing protein [Paenibacillus swuensis]ANE45642.1 hypothetical protein SY83_04255 [Paenibacillus swuensis]